MKVWYKRMLQELDHATLALQSIKDKEIGRANRRREETKFQVGDLVLVRVFTVNRTQLNKGGAFANRWAGPCKVIEQVAHQSYRLELPIRAASRMGYGTPTRSGYCTSTRSKWTFLFHAGSLRATPLQPTVLEERRPASKHHASP